jgi:hypothetical protein
MKNGTSNRTVFDSFIAASYDQASHSDGTTPIGVEACTFRVIRHSSGKPRRRVRLRNHERLMKQTERAVFLCPCPVTQNLLLPFLAEFAKSCCEIARLDNRFDLLPIAVNRKLQILQK